MCVCDTESKSLRTMAGLVSMHALGRAVHQIGIAVHQIMGFIWRRGTIFFAMLWKYPVCRYQRSLFIPAECISQKGSPHSEYVAETAATSVAPQQRIACTLASTPHSTNATFQSALAEFLVPHCKKPKQPSKSLKY
jgi:hypothetical protein